MITNRVSPYFQNEKIEPKKSNRKIEQKVEPKIEPKYPASNWEEVYENIRKMRADKTAPVDTLGCDECYAKCATDKERRFQVYLSGRYFGVHADLLPFSNWSLY